MWLTPDPPNTRLKRVHSSSANLKIIICAFQLSRKFQSPASLKNQLPAPLKSLWGVRPFRLGGAIMTPYRKNITYRQYFWGVRPSRLRGLSSPNCHRTSKGKFNFRWWKRSACARPPSKLQVAVAKTTRSCETSWKTLRRGSSRENEALVRVILQELQVECVKTEAFVQGFLQKTCKLKVWNRSFRARLPSKTAIRSRENEAFVRDILRKLQVAIATTKV